MSENLDLITLPLQGTNLIEASAGTGKTYTIANLYLRFLLEKEWPVNEVLVVTFTEAATKELRTRLRRNIDLAWQLVRDNTQRARRAGQGEHVAMIVNKYLENGKDAERARLLLRQAIVNFDEAAIYTIHGFCQRMLNENAFEGHQPFDVELVTSDRDLVDQVVNDLWRRLVYSADGAFYYQILKAGKLDLGLLGKLAGIVHANPDPEVITKPAIPGCGVSLDWTGLSNKIEGLLKDLKKEWKKNGKRIRADFDDLYKSIKKKEREQWLEGFKTLDNAKDLLDYIEVAGRYTPEKIKAGFNKRYKGQIPYHHFFDLCEEAVKAIHKAVVRLEYQFILDFQKAVNALKQERRVRDFNDILLGMRKALEGDNAYTQRIRSMFRAAMIDEFQDTDPVQYDIFNRLFIGDGQGPPENVVFFIGDPKQSIYRFRGADIYAYLRAKGDVDKQYTLTRNFRSEKPMVDAVNGFFSHNADPFLEEDIPFECVDAAGMADNENAFFEEGSPPGDRLRIMRISEGPVAKAKAVDMTVQAIKDEVVRLLNQGAAGTCGFQDKETHVKSPVRPSDIAILVDTHKNARSLHKALAAAGVPSVMQSTGNVFESEEARDMIRVMKAVATPADRLIRPALLTPMFGYTVDDMVKKGENLVQGYYEGFMELSDLWQAKGFMTMFNNLMVRYDMRKKLLGQVNAERCLTNILHISELLNQAEQEDKKTPYDIIKWLSRRVAEVSESRGEVPVEHEIRLERDDNALKLVTVHASKGLEFPVVFCAFEWSRSYAMEARDRFMPVYDEHRGKRVLFLDETNEDFQKKLRHEKRAENMRLLYVAMTRAKNLCYLCVPYYKSRAGLSLSFSAFAHLFAKGDTSEAGVDDVLSELGVLARDSGGNISVVQVKEPANDVKYQGVTNTDQVLTVRDFTGQIDRNFGVTSFSGLTKNMPHVHVDPGGDEGSDDAGPKEEKRPALPKGLYTGLAVHEIFEGLDFQNTGNMDDLIRSRVGKYALDAHGDTDKIVDEIHRMVDNVLNEEIRPKMFLRDVDQASTLREMQFFYRLKPGGIQNMAEIFRKHNQPDIAKALNERLANRQVHGFMNGFIDLLFEHGDKYFVLDWKTNFLGPGPGDYTDKAIKASMAEAMYFLQYHIYVVAAHLLLKQRSSGYDYARHFGGVIYAYTRGMQKNGNMGHSTYFELPDKALIEDLTDLFIEG